MMSSVSYQPTPSTIMVMVRFHCMELPALSVPSWSREQPSPGSHFLPDSAAVPISSPLLPTLLEGHEVFRRLHPISLFLLATALCRLRPRSLPSTSSWPQLHGHSPSTIPASPRWPPSSHGGPELTRWPPVSHYGPGLPRWPPSSHGGPELPRRSRPSLDLPGTDDIPGSWRLPPDLLDSDGLSDSAPSHERLHPLSQTLLWPVPILPSHPGPLWAASSGSQSWPWPSPTDSMQLVPVDSATRHRPRLRVHHPTPGSSAPATSGCSLSPDSSDSWLFQPSPAMTRRESGKKKKAPLLPTRHKGDGRFNKFDGTSFVRTYPSPS